MRTALIWTALFILLLAAIVGPFVLFEEAIAEGLTRVLAAPLGVGALAASICASQALDIVLPLPSSVLGVVSGALMGFWVGTAVCWAGLTLGCGIGYWIGATGGTAAVRRLLGPGELARAARTARRIGPAAPVLARAVPVLAEASVVAAGMARMPLAAFVPAAALSNLGIAATYAAVGTLALSRSSVVLAFTGAIAVPALAWGRAQLWRRWRAVRS